MPMKPIRNGNKCGRNEACPCGSNKKLKKCCKKSSHKLPRRLVLPRVIENNPDFNAVAGSEAVAHVTKLLVNNNLPPKLIYLFYQTGTVFSEYNVRFLNEAAAQTVMAHIERWSHMSEAEQNAWIEQWRSLDDDAD